MVLAILTNGVKLTIYRAYLDPPPFPKPRGRLCPNSEITGCTDWERSRESWEPIDSSAQNMSRQSTEAEQTANCSVCTFSATLTTETKANSRVAEEQINKCTGSENVCCH
jgi:hypothetical protein